MMRLTISQPLGTPAHNDIAAGGPGSGNWGHAGREGKQGGSVSRGTAMSIKSGQDWQTRQAAKKSAQQSVGAAPFSAKTIGQAEFRQRVVNGQAMAVFRDYQIGSLSFGPLAHLKEPVGSGNGTLSVSFSKAAAKKIPIRRRMMTNYGFSIGRGIALCM